jgi:hypothetical protein
MFKFGHILILNLQISTASAIVYEEILEGEETN